MSRSIRRTVGRGVRRTELWHGNREDPRWWLSRDPDRNVMLWAWTQHPVNRRKLDASLAAGDPVVRLSGQGAADRWLAGLT